MFKDMNEMEEMKNESEKLKKEITRNPGNFASPKLYSLLHVEETRLVHGPLQHKDLVCEADRCARAEKGRLQVCCRDSTLPRFYSLHMNFLDKCKVCGCDKSQHRWGTIETKVVTDKRVVAEIVDSCDAMKQIRSEMLQCENRVKEWKDEIRQMIEICAKLNAFAYQKAPLTASTEEVEPLKALENERQAYTKSSKTGNEANYIEEIKKHLNKETEASCYTAVDVSRLIQQLCKLPINGNEIKRIVDGYEKSRRHVVEEGQRSKKLVITECASGMTSDFGKGASCATQQVQVPPLLQRRRESHSSKVSQGQQDRCQSMALTEFPETNHDSRYGDIRKTENHQLVLRRSHLPDLPRSTSLSSYGQLKPLSRSATFMDSPYSRPLSPEIGGDQSSVQTTQDIQELRRSQTSLESGPSEVNQTQPYRRQSVTHTGFPRIR